MKFYKAVLLIIAMLSIIAITGKSYASSTTYYAPETNLEKIDIHWLNKALYSPYKVVCVAMYSFTDKKIARELLYLANNGVKIYIYRDDKQMRDGTDVTYMLRNNGNIIIRAKRDKGFWNIMHDKLFIIPGVVFREGSANWSPSAEGASCYSGNCGPAENQDNNATYITNRGEINQAYKIFVRIFNRANNLNF
ncbi:MAG: phospholipase D-like domain-containing protein [bacterium]